MRLVTFLVVGIVCARPASAADARRTRLVDIVARAIPSVGQVVPAGTTRLSAATGFVVHPDGHVLTAYHVVGRNGGASVRLAPGAMEGTIPESLSAELVQAQPAVDLALLRLRVGKPLRALAFSRDATARLGEPVVAIGHPFGLLRTVTRGIVSGLYRPILVPSMENAPAPPASVRQS